MRNTLILTVGLPRSGKTTWAKEYARSLGFEDISCAIVNPDSIRRAFYNWTSQYIPTYEDEVWRNAIVQVRSHFFYGTPVVILDATSLTQSARARWDFSSEWNTFYKPIGGFSSEEVETYVQRAKTDGNFQLALAIRRMVYTAEAFSEREQENVLTLEKECDICNILNKENS